ncbi:hypothetical protein ACWGKH_08845, partial [Streptomyces sp. NPDC054756]
MLGGAEGGARVGSGGLELPPGDEGHEGNSPDVPPGTVSLARGGGGAPTPPAAGWGAPGGGGGGRPAPARPRRPP